MDDRVIAAAQNNAEWCDIVCRSHGLPTLMSELMWIAPAGSPRLYPDAVTLAPRVPVDSVLSQIHTGPSCSVKDSFADLDLSGHGFTVLFDAHWFFREPGRPRRHVPSGWQLITTDEDFQRWAVAADLTGIIRPELLHEQAVRILAVHRERAVAAGAIVNRSGKTVGLSNVFTTANAPALLWRDLPAAIAEAFGGVPIVGYEHDRRLVAAADGGFEAIGPLRVWLKPAA
jgi:hypothetical protein